MPVVHIPPLLRDLTQGQTRLTVPGSTVKEVVHHLEQDYPGIADRLCQDGQVRPGIAVVVDGVACPGGLRQQLAESSELHFLPALSGG